MNIIRFLPIAFFILNLTLLLDRKKAWVRNPIKWYAVLLLSLIGLVLFVFHGFKKFDELNLIFWGLMTPAVFSLTDLLFKKLSFLIHKRDFYLWLKGSSDEDANCKASDRIMSVFLLYYTLALPFVPGFFSRH